MEYKVGQHDRRKVIKRLEELTGERAVYSGSPYFTYAVQGIILTRNNHITIYDESRTEMLETLVREGLVEAEGREEERVASQDVQDDTQDDTHAAAESPVTPGESSTEALIRRETDFYDSLIETIPEVVITFPLSAHRAESIINLVCTLHARGKLMSKITGGCFTATEDLVRELRNLTGYHTAEQVISIIHRTGGLCGISFDTENIIFDGFPATDDDDFIKAWTALCSAINQTSIRQLHVRPEINDNDNEKFVLRTWMTKLGMNGPELKRVRKTLSENLKGHAAFRTRENEERWKEKQRAGSAKLKTA